MTLNEFASESEYLQSRKACEYSGLGYQTLRNYAEQGKIKTYRTPSGQRMYNKSCLKAFIGDGHADERKKVIYCRVSSKKQLDDLERQCNSLQSSHPNHILIKDCGSGINYKRKGLQTILEWSMQGKLEEIVVAHKDRMCRFGFELIEFICSKNNTRIIILDKEEHQSSDQELAEDIMSIITVFACKQMGKRKYKINNKNEEDKTISKSDSTKNIN
jgi:predicted site-specific integrase-resolvase